MESFLLELLNVGSDCRNIGLVWIIKKLWSFGDQVMINHFPNFLDSKSRQFLLKVFILFDNEKENEKNNKPRKNNCQIPRAFYEL